MGWYGDYKNVNEVMAEKESEIERSDRYIVYSTKETKTYGIILVKDTLDDSFALESFIFYEGSYKPIYFLSDSNYFSRIPKKWLKLLNSERQIQLIKEQKEIAKEERERKASQPSLDSILVVGKQYKIWDTHTATYKFKEKRSYIFEKDGRLTRFTSLKPTDVKEI